jgi:hypothetical protein
MPVHQHIHGANWRFHSQRCWPDSDERARTHDLLGEVARAIRRARLGFVSSGRIETARDDRARFGAINQGRRLPSGVEAAARRRVVLPCLAQARARRHESRTADLSSEECRTGLTYVGRHNPPRTQHKGRRAAEIVPNQRISETPTSPNAATTEPSSTGDRGSSTRSGMAFVKSAPDASYRELSGRSKIPSRSPVGTR